MTKSTSILKIAILIAATLTICAVLISTFNNMRNHVTEQNIEHNIRSGVITDMEIVTSDNVFTEAQLLYRIHIKSNYIYENETKTGYTYYDVPRDIYESYKIGDNFNISDYRKKNTNDRGETENQNGS